MLTIFTCPKPFTDPYINMIQRNAITSWTLLRPRPEIILFGGEPYEPGVAEICQELGLRHVPTVLRNEWGTPFLDDIFQKANDLSSYDILAYVNADIILTNDFPLAVRTLTRLYPFFLMVGHRIDLNVEGLLEFDSNNKWVEILRHNAKQKGLPMKISSDYFVFPKGLLKKMPSFLVGRPAWDNWLIWYFRKHHVPVINVGEVVLAVHQICKETENWLNTKSVRIREEVKYNRSLATWWQSSFVLVDATHVVISRWKIRRNTFRAVLHRGRILFNYIRYAVSSRIHRL